MPIVENYLIVDNRRPSAAARLHRLMPFGSDRLDQHEFRHVLLQQHLAGLSPRSAPADLPSGERREPAP